MKVYNTEQDKHGLGSPARISSILRGYLATTTRWIYIKYQLEKKIFTKVINEFWKIKKSNFLENGSTDLDG